LLFEVFRHQRSQLFKIDYVPTDKDRFYVRGKTWLAQPQVFAFFDGGTVRINQDPFLPTQNRISMYGAGVGFNVLTADAFAVRGSVAWRIGSEPVPGVTNPSAQGWIQVVKFF
jgi:hemolysin activation/secretion protein